MCAEKVALRLDHVGGGARGAHHVEPRKPRPKCRHRQAIARPGRHYGAQTLVATFQMVGKERCQHQPACCIVGQRLRHVVQHAGPDDAALPPDFGDVGQRQRPAKSDRRLGNQREALRITQDLAGNHRLLQIVQRQRPQRKFAGCRPKDRLAGPALIQPRRDIARHHRRLDHRDRGGQMLRLDHGPASGALLPGLVQNDIQHRRPGIGVFGIRHGGGYFDQIGLQRATIPLFQNRADFLCPKTQTVPHHAVNLGDHLHVGIFDAVVHRLHKMPGPTLAHVGGAGRAFVAGCDCVQDRRHPVPVGPQAATHDRRAMPRAFFAARHANAQKMRSIPGRIGGARVGVAEIGVARVDDQIVFVHQGAQGGNLVIHRLARRHHQDDRAGFGNCRHQIGQTLGRHDVFGQSPGPGKEVARGGRGAVPHRNRKALFRDVQGQHRPHRTKADKPDCWFGHGVCTPLRFRVRT